jgi:ribonuclease HI
MQWIPGHTGIQGNDTADMLANSYQPNKPVTQTTAKQIIRQKYSNKWMNQRALRKTGRVVYNYMNNRNYDDVDGLDKGEQTINFRLRCQHVELDAHLNRNQPKLTSLQIPK